jgi:hypothetical protein
MEHVDRRMITVTAVFMFFTCQACPSYAVDDLFESGVFLVRLDAHVQDLLHLFHVFEGFR